MVIIGWRKGWVTLLNTKFGWLSTTKFDWFVTIKSIHDEELESMWVGSYINCSRPWVEVTESICTPSMLDMAYLYLFDDHALKSPIIVKITSFWLDIAFVKTSKLLRNFSNSSFDWLGEQYNVAIKHFLFLFSSQGQRPTRSKSFCTMVSLPYSPAISTS